MINFYPCYCYYFLLMTQLFVQVKTGWESRFFCVMHSVLLPKILLNPRQRLLLAKQRQRVI